MPNRKPRSKVQPSCVWAVTIRDHEAFGNLIEQRDPRYTVTVIEYNRAAPLNRLVRDFRALITQQRYALTALDDLADEFRLGDLATVLRRQPVEAAMEARMRLGFPAADVIKAFDEVPWPSANKVLKILGPPWKLHRVKKLLKRVRAQQRQLATAASKVRTD